MKLKAKIATLASAGALAAGMVLVPAGTASAYNAYDCYVGYDTTGAYSYCGAQTHRVRLLCQNWFSRSSHWNWGPWTKGGQRSNTSCAWYEWALLPVNVETTR